MGVAIVSRWVAMRKASLHMPKLWAAGLRELAGVGWRKRLDEEGYGGGEVRDQNHV